MEINRKRVAKRLASGFMAGALALGGLAISGAGSAGAVPIEEDSDQRIAGTDRYSTSADIAATIEDEAGDIETLVVASGENFPDALAAAGLTHNDGATPAAVLLVESDSIPAGVLAQMNRIDDSVTQVYVVGGESAISDDVVADIEDIFGDASVDRIAGDNRYETAIRVADEIGHADGTVILASGTSFADAITVGAWASANATPILLANADGLPTETEDELSDLIDGGDGVVDRVIIIGGTAAVGSVEEDLVEMGLAPAGVSRVAGANRYATNLQWNVENFSTSFFTPKALTADESQNLNGVTQLYASGANYPDALAAAPLAAELGAHVILVDPVSVGASALTLATVGKTAVTVDNSTLGTQVRSAIYDGAVNDGTEEFFGQNIWIVGGTNAVPTSVMSTIEGASAQSLGCSVILRKANDNDDLTGDGIGPDLAIISWDGNLQSDAEMTAGEIDPAVVLDGTELATLLSVDAANDLIDIEGTAIAGDDDGVMDIDDPYALDLDEDGFADAVLYTLEDALAEGDTVEFTGIEVDASDYADGTYTGLRELTSCSASVERDNTEPTVTVNAVDGETEIVVSFSERMNDDYSGDLEDDAALEDGIGDVTGCDVISGSANAQYRCTLAAAADSSDSIGFDDETYYDYAGNELDYSDGVADFEVIDAEDYSTSIEDFTVTCESLGSGDAKVQVWDGYSTDSGIDNARSGLITIPFDDGDVHLLAGTGVPGLSANDWSFTIENQRGLLIPTVEADGTDVVVTIDSFYHDADDVEWAIRQSAVGGGGLSGKWLDDALAGSLLISGAGAFDAGNLGEDYTTADADTSTIEVQVGVVGFDDTYDTLEPLVEGNVGSPPLPAATATLVDTIRAAINAAGGDEDDATDPVFITVLTTFVNGILDDAGESTAAGFGEADQQCLWTATLTTPLYGDSYDDLGPATGAANVSGELIVKFGSDVQTFVADDVYYDGANFISGVITSTTDAADSPVMELNVNGSKATASAS